MDQTGRMLALWARSLLIMTALQGYTPTQIDAQASEEMTPEARDYLGKALDLMQSYSLRRKDVDWPKVRHEAASQAKGARTTEDTYPAIAFACTQLKQKYSTCLAEPSSTPVAIRVRTQAIESHANAISHGRLLTPSPHIPFARQDQPSVDILHYKNRTYGYVSVALGSGFTADGGYMLSRHAWAERLYRTITEASLDGVNGWILDLRASNTWGYFDPLFAGFRSLLGNGKLLEFRGTGTRHTTFLKNGQVMEQVRFSQPYVGERIQENEDFSQKDSPVVILFNHDTSGAGEVLAIAFKGRKKTYFIGQRTAGFTGEEVVWPLSDGARLKMITEQIFDRTGQTYPEGLSPDLEMVDPPPDTPIDRDPAVLAAQEWIAHQI